MKVLGIEEILDAFDAAYEAKMDASGGMAHNSECNRAGLQANGTQKWCVDRGYERATIENCAKAPHGEGDVM